MIRAALAATFWPAVLGAAPNAKGLDATLQDVSQSLAWSSIGCYMDTSARVFQGNVTASSGMTIAACESFCSDYPYHGLQYGSECYCGDYDADYDQYGPSSSCNTVCAGDSSETCGGKWAMNVYTQAETDPASIGCFTDTGTRALTGKYTDKSNMSPTLCISRCEEMGYYYAATQWGEECWCGDSGVDLDVYGAGVCDRPCSGDPTKFCGGNYTFTAYEIVAETDPGIDPGIDPETDPSYLGCFKDTQSVRVFSEVTNTSSNDVEYCKSYCGGRGAGYMGLQNGDQCWCGYGSVDYDQHGTATCDTPCPGDSSEICGGTWAFSAYKIESEGTCGGCPEAVFEQTKPVPAPTPVITIPGYDPSCLKASVRWASSTGPAGRVYIEGGGCATLTDVYNERSDNNGAKGPIYILDENDDVIVGAAEPTGKWLLMGELYVEDGSVLYVHGTSIGGDCDELRIQSEGNLFHEIRGHGGSLSFRNTLVTSWDRTTKAPSDDYENGRSFINCVSEHAPKVECVGQAKKEMGECRMDIINSEMGHLGYFASESYGLTWKVRGFCKDKSNPEVFDDTNVYGDIINSDIHHMYYGTYSYGRQGGVWTDSIMRDNYQYGFYAHDDSDYLTISGNLVYNNVNHGIMVSVRCNNVEIYDNEVYDGGAQAAGIFLDRSIDSASIYNNYVHDMQGAGLANLGCFDSEVYGNVFENLKYGTRLSSGASNNYIHDNQFINCAQYGLYTYVDSSGRPTGNMFYDNEILDTAVGLTITGADDTVIVGNVFTGTEVMQFTDSSGTIWCGNDIPPGTCKNGTSGSTPSTYALECDLPPDC